MLGIFIMLKPLRIIAIGRLRTSFWAEAAKLYLERLKHWRKIEETILRDANQDLSIIDRNTQEGKRILAVVKPEDIVICLDEKGKSFTSKEFSQFLDSFMPSQRPCFIVGGAFGLSPEVMASAKHTICLGKMTLPHELARVVLLEQIYRAECISRKIKYHHE